MDEYIKKDAVINAIKFLSCTEVDKGNQLVDIVDFAAELCKRIEKMTSGAEVRK